MDDETLEAAISLTAWCIMDAEKNRDIDVAIESLRRIYGYLTDTEMEE